MNAKELADKLNGIGYGERISPELLANAEESGLVIVYHWADVYYGDHGEPEADSYIEMDGAVFYEGDAYEDNTLVEIEEHGIKINVRMHNRPPYWTYETPVPHRSFNVMQEGGVVFCKGIVFALADVGKVEV